MKRWILDYAYYVRGQWHWGTEAYKTKKDAVEAATYYDSIHDGDTPVCNADNVYKEVR